MNRRDFGKSLVAVGAALALPAAAAAKPAINHEFFGQHLTEFDDNDAIITTAHRAYGTLWYGNMRPGFIMSPYRVVGRVWANIIWNQRVRVECSRSKFNCGFLFNGATWFGNDALTDEVVLINERYLAREFNGWYRASRLVLDDPLNDYHFARMIGRA
jgi:hypothetical protein